MSKKNSKTGILKCVKCGYTEKFNITCPAAPILSLCEEAEKVGWGYSIGFFSMMTGDHRPVCPKCLTKIDYSN